ncbi:MAG: hypothetical protein GC153_09970 [Alphaproteobacteria bacterium]|nr:hypothetical protein [Alphaproteobacteria bacterium]
MFNRREKAPAGRGVWALLSALALSLAAAPAAAGAIPAPVNTGAAWRIVKDHWSAADEKGYEAFVQAIGRSNCDTLESCLKDPANPYRNTDHRSYHGDCADMAYMLRAYYAWKNGLPFSYQSSMRTADGSSQDIRYSDAGNVVASRRDAVGREAISAPGYIARIGEEVSTAMFRTDPVKGGGRSYDDFYPIEISRAAVRPGAVAYDIYGHVGIIYDVLDDGRIMLVASHPDNSVTRTTYGPNFLQAKAALGAGLKAWRPVRLVGARRRSDGTYVGGHVRGAPNAEIPDFSMIQFDGNVAGAPYAEFVYDGRTLSYYDFVRRSLAAPGFAYNPVDELKHGLETICEGIRDRNAAVDRAIDAKVYLQPHPKRLPYNIYGTYGQWEDYSTPSRDARLKVSFIEMRRQVERLYERYLKHDPSVRYSGDDLPKALLSAFVAEEKACAIIYRRSDDTRVRLNLGNVMDRLWDLSFDPYNCPERRWGAKGVELETCTDDETKTRWYNAQRFLRYQADRTYDVRMDFTVDELQPPMAAPPAEGGLGADAPPDADIRAYLARINGATMASAAETPEILPIADEAAPAWRGIPYRLNGTP